MSDTRRWGRNFKLGPFRLGVTLLKHTYAPGHGERWVLQTSTLIDRKDAR